MKKYLFAVLSFVTFSLAAQNPKFFKTDKKTGKYFHFAQVGTRKFGVTTDLVDIVYSGMGNLGLQFAVSRAVGAELAFGIPVNDKPSRVKLPYFYFNDAASRNKYQLQQTIYAYFGQMGIRSNAYVGLNFRQIFVESNMGLATLVNTSRREVNFLLGSQRTLLGALQIGWEAGVGGFRVKGPDLSLQNIMEDEERSKGTSFLVKVKLGYLIF